MKLDRTHWLLIIAVLIVCLVLLWLLLPKVEWGRVINALMMSSS